MKKQSWWRHPELVLAELVLVYGVFGAFVGLIVGIDVCSEFQKWATSFAWDTLHHRITPNAARGLVAAHETLSDRTIDDVRIFNAVLGSFTGCLLVHVFGKYRFTASFILTAVGSLAVVLSAQQGLAFATTHGSVAAFGVFGVLLLWSLSLLCLGIYLIAKDVNSSKSDLQ